MKIRKTIVLSISLISSFVHANQEADIEKYLKDNEGKTIYGPATVEIKKSATMDLSYGQAFLPEDVTKGLFRLLGSKPKDDLAGAVMPGIQGKEEYKDDWGFIALESNEDGHISDEDAKSKNLSLLLDDLRKNIKPETKIKVLTWINQPNYNEKTHTFTWSFSNVKDENDYFDAYQSYVLGRSGLVGFTYISKTDERARREPLVYQLINSIKFKDGHRYDDYKAGSDKLSTMGLTALVAGGVVAKKLGLFAIIAAIFAKFGKATLLIVGSVLAILRSKKRKKRSSNNLTKN